MKLSLTLLFLQLWGNVELSLSQNACSKLPDVPHAHVSEETKKTEYQEGDVIHFTCESGYISDQTSKYVCTGAGWRVVRRGMCYSCSVLPDVPHAHVTDETRKAEYQEGDVIHFTCESGYMSDVTIKYVCASEGWLAVRQGLCYYPCQVGKMHPRLFVAGLPPPNEIIKTGHKLRFQCSNDLTLDGSEEIVCLETGQWSAPFPACSVITCEVGALHLGLIVTGMRSTSETVQVGVKLQFECSSEFQLDGSNETECLPTGKWSAPIPTCSDKCEVSGLPDNIIITPRVSGSHLTKGETLTFSCSRRGEIIQGNATVECLASGQWSDPFPTCRVRPCPHPDETPNGSYRIIEGDDFVFGTAIQYVCYQGYQMVGDDTLNCSLDGWTGTAPTCKLITCEVGVLHPGLIVTGMLSTSTTVQVGDKLQFDCSGELQLDGSKETECLPTGKWSAPIPTCSEKCKVPRIPDNINVTPRVSGRHLTKGEKLTFSCSRRGEFIQGNPTAECLASGEWSDPFPTCGAPATCGKPPSLADGDTKDTVDFLYRHNARVEYICQNLYQMEGGPFKICKNGEWIGQMRCLQPCTMDTDVMTTRNIRFRYSYEEKLYAPHNDVINFSCTHGTRPFGTVGMRQKCIDGVMNFPTCE